MAVIKWDSEINRWTKVCSTCKTNYEIEAGPWKDALEVMRKFFSPAMKSIDYLSTRCKECEANRLNGRSTNGPKREDMLKAQDGKCAICEKPTSFGGYHTACIDHDHETGAVRGVLCSPCNKTLGTVSDDVEILQKAINYLTLHKAKR